MTRILSLCLIGLLLSACTFTIQPETGSGTIPPLPVESDLVESELAGIYKAFTPAASSPGIEMTLTLAADGSASWKWDYLEPDSVRTELGTWTVEEDGTVSLRFVEQQVGDEVQIYEAPTEVTLTEQADGTLQQLPETPEAIGIRFYPFTLLATGELAPNYVGDAVNAEIEAGNWAGWYKAFMPAASSPGIDSTLLLAFDQSVRWTSDYLDGESPIVEVGTWEANDDGTVTVTITGREDEAADTPQTITFALEDDLLTAVEYDEGVYGSAGLQFYSLYGLALAAMPE